MEQQAGEEREAQRRREKRRVEVFGCEAGDLKEKRGSEEKRKKEKVIVEGVRREEQKVQLM